MVFFSQQQKYAISICGISKMIDQFTYKIFLCEIKNFSNKKWFVWHVTLKMYQLLYYYIQCTKSMIDCAYNKLFVD